MKNPRTHRIAPWPCRLLPAALAVGFLLVGAVALGQPTTTAEPAPGSAEAKPGAPASTPGGAPEPAGAEAPRAADPVRVQTPDKFDLHLKNEDVANVLEMLSRQYALNLVASKDIKGKVTADLYQVSLDQVLDAICRSNGLQWTREGDFIYVYTAEEAASKRTDVARLTTEVFPLNYLTAAEASKLIAPALSAKATVAANTASEVGIPSGADQATGGDSFGLSDSIVVRDFPENLEQARTILKQMDRRPRQVLVEATILEVTLDDSTSLGVDFNALAGIDFRDLSTTTSSVADPTTVPNDPTVTVPLRTQNAFGQARTQGFATPGTGLNIGVMTNNVAFFIHALEEVTDTTILSNPKVLALNKQRAEVIVGDRLGYRTITTTETTTVESVDFLETGTQLIFRPFISDDGYIRLEIHPKVSSGTVVGGIPNERTTEVTCNIMVKDGHTVVIGGLFKETTSIARSQVPGLGNVPGFGWLFRNKADSTERNEIIVLLTPHVIEDDEAARLIGEQALDDDKRRCLGMREGFSFFTRERLSVAYLQEADRAWQRYEKNGGWLNLNWSWWNLQLALNVAPNNLKALRLKDRILAEKHGHPVEPPNWTLWDSLGPRLKAMDQAKIAATTPAATVPPSPANPPAATAPDAAPADKEVTHEN